MAKSTKQADLLVEAFALLAERGWAAFSLAELARRTETPLVEVYGELPTHGSLLSSLGRRLDRAMLGIDLAELEELSPRERTFELIMRRFDAMAPFKGGFRVLAREARLDPMVILGSVCNLDRAMAWLVDVSGADLARWQARAARRALLLVYVRVFNVWLGDDTPDLANTLAELDKRLQQLEQLTRWGRRMRSRASRAGLRPGAAAADGAA